MSAEKSRQDAAHAQLFAAILELRNVQECHDFFEDLCTIAERKAMSARLEVARMLKNAARSYRRAKKSPFFVPFFQYSSALCRIDK